MPHWDLPLLAGAGGLRSSVADLLAFLRLQLGEGAPVLARAAALTHTPRSRCRGIAVGFGWTRLSLVGTEHELLFNNGGTGGFRSFAGFVSATATAVVVLSNPARSVDALGSRILERIGALEAPIVGSRPAGEPEVRLAFCRANGDGVEGPHSPNPCTTSCQ